MLAAISRSKEQLCQFFCERMVICGKESGFHLAEMMRDLRTLRSFGHSCNRLQKSREEGFFLLDSL